MAKKKIVSIGVDFPLLTAESLDFDYKHSLLDADIIIFAPHIPLTSGESNYQGKRALSANNSIRIREALTHWRQELSSALTAGKLVVILLDAPEIVWAATGRLEYSGTGRNSRTTQIVEKLSSYAAIPFDYDYTAAEGSGMQLMPNAQFLKSYWTEFESESYYKVYFGSNIANPLVKTKSGNRIVAAAIKSEIGTALLLPFIDFKDDAYTETRTVKGKEGQYWSKLGLSVTKNFCAALVAMSDSLAAESNSSPPPTWVTLEDYRTNQERILANEVAKITKDIQLLEKSRQEVEEKHRSAGSLRKLLYEQGKPLEMAILEALRLMGFQAEGFESLGSEFDAVFTSEEGRFIGEAEGKDNKAINIDKFSQLERNIGEDFQREEITEHAKGVLFGNAFRLTQLSERKDTFTSKCLLAAKRLGVALVNTSDLFAPASYLKQTKDETYAKQCRLAIVATQGEIVKFPPLPSLAVAMSPQVESEAKTAPEN